MSRNGLYKILAFLILLAELIVFFILFGQINELAESAGSTKILLVIAVILTVSLFILTISATYKKDSEDKYNRDNKLTSLKDESKTKASEDQSDDNEILDVVSYLKRILPKPSAKLNVEKLTEKILSNIAKEFDIVQGLFFIKEKEKDVFNIVGKYAYFGEEEPKSFKTGETISGQVAKNKKALILEEIPDDYITILSGLGSSSPDHVIIIPIISDNETIAIIELASFKEFKSNFIDLFEGMSDEIANTISKY